MQFVPTNLSDLETEWLGMSQCVVTECALYNTLYYVTDRLIASIDGPVASGRMKGLVL